MEIRIKKKWRNVFRTFTLGGLVGTPHHNNITIYTYTHPFSSPCLVMAMDLYVVDSALWWIFTYAYVATKGTTLSCCDDLENPMVSFSVSRLVKKFSEHSHSAGS
jgi:hypothetical protein